MRKATLIRGARQLLTLRGPGGPRRGTGLRNLGIIQDGSVLIVDGIVVEVGPTRRLENLAIARDAEEIDASGCLVLPGFVDSHMQVVGGTPRLARPIHEISPRALESIAQRVVEEAVRNGTSAMEAKSGLGLTEAGEMKIVRVQAELRELPLTFGSTFVASGLSMDLVERLLSLVRRRKLVEFAEIRLNPDVYTAAEVCRFLTLARDLGLGLKVSAAERPNPAAVAMAAEAGATCITDVLHATERDAMLLAQSQTIATLSPAVAFDRHDALYPPARMLIDQGVAVALATGCSSAAAPSPSMQLTIALACRAMRMTVAEAIASATINGAHAMGRARYIGSIETGKSADLVMLTVPDYRELPYHLGVNLVNLVMIRGAVRLERSEVKWPPR
jgi:imidazolonepropionase